LFYAAFRKGTVLQHRIRERLRFTSAYFCTPGIVFSTEHAGVLVRTSALVRNDSPVVSQSVEANKTNHTLKSRRKTVCVQRRWCRVHCSLSDKAWRCDC